jgi:hypothetical protein
MSLIHKNYTIHHDSVTEVTIRPENESFYKRNLSISIQNLDPVNFVLIGDSTITSSSFGYRIDPGTSFTADLGETENVYAITDQGDADVAIIWVIS